MLGLLLISSRPFTFQAGIGEDYLCCYQDYNRDYAIEDGDSGVLHGDSRQLRDHDDNHQLKRLQLSYLPFPIMRSSSTVVAYRIKVRMITRIVLSLVKHNWLISQLAK